MHLEAAGIVYIKQILNKHNIVKTPTSRVQTKAKRNPSSFIKSEWTTVFSRVFMRE